MLTVSINALMMEAVSISETLVNFYQTMKCNIPEDSHLKVLQIIAHSFYKICTHATGSIDKQGKSVLAVL
jgi:hypothetical protein